MLDQSVLGTALVGLRCCSLAYEIVWTRLLVLFLETTTYAFTVMLAAFLPRFGLGMLRTRRPGIQFLRSALLFTSNLSFFFANVMKLLEGGWFPVIVGIVVFILLSTWKRGREVLFERLRPGAIALEPFIKSITAHPPVRAAAACARGPSGAACAARRSRRRGR